MSLMTTSRASALARIRLRSRAARLIEVGVEQQRRHADHAVHRRADLVAHVRQELAARAARGLRLRARLGERLAQFRELLLKFRDGRAGGHLDSLPSGTRFT